MREARRNPRAPGALLCGTAAEDSVEKAKSWFRPFARAGYGARGLIYTVVGMFAVFAAIGSGQAIGSRDALDLLLATGFGLGAAYVLTFGLVCYALWRLIQAVFDTDSHGNGAKGLAIRGGLLASAAIYSTLAVYTFSRTRFASAGSEGSGRGGADAAEAIAGFLGTRLSAAVVALVLAGVAAAHIVKAVRERYAAHIRADASTMRVIHPIAKAGLVARGLVFAVLALLLGRRALAGQAADSETGLKEALEFIQSLPAGTWLLAAMGGGLLAFAAYSFAEAIYRRINVEDA